METRVEIDTILFSQQFRFPFELPAGDKLVAKPGMVKIEWAPSLNVYEVTVEGRGQFLLHKSDTVLWATVMQRQKKGGR